MSINMISEFNGYYEEEYFMYDGFKINYRECLFSGYIGAGINGEVYVDKHFMNLSENAQQFVLLHEIKHIKENHKGGLWYLIRRSFAASIGFVIKEERIADRNALTVMNKNDIINAINEIVGYTKNLNIFNEKQLKGFVNEFKTRIRLIKRFK